MSAALSYSETRQAVIAGAAVAGLPPELSPATAPKKRLGARQLASQAEAAQRLARFEALLRRGDMTLVGAAAALGIGKTAAQEYAMRLRGRGVDVTALIEAAVAQAQLDAAHRRSKGTRERAVPVIREHQAAGKTRTACAKALRIDTRNLDNICKIEGISLDGWAKRGPKPSAASAAPERTREEAHPPREPAPLRREWALQVWQLLCSGVKLERVAAMYRLEKPTVEALRLKLAKRGMAA